MTNCTLSNKEDLFDAGDLEEKLTRENEERECNQRATPPIKSFELRSFLVLSIF